MSSTQVHVDAHENFTRVGHDLEAPLLVDAREMVFGFVRLVEHLDGSLISVERDEPAPPGTEIRIAGRGFRRFDDDGPGDEYGDFVLRVDVGIPETDLDERGAERRGLFEGLVGKI